MFWERQKGQISHSHSLTEFGEMNKCSRLESSKWAPALSVDPAFVILDKLLEPIDHVHFAAVCNLWRSLAKHYNRTTRRWSKLHLPPMLLLPGPDVLYSLCEGQIYDKIHLTMPGWLWPSSFQTCRYYGCGHGWLFQLRFLAGIYCCLNLLNPFTKELRALMFRDRGGWTNPATKLPPKLILSGDPSVNGDDNLMLVGFDTTHSTLGFTRGNHLLWSNVETMEGYAITDAVFYRGRVYAVDKNYGMIVSFDVESCSPGKSTRAKIHHATGMKRRPCSQAYLVQSTKGELLHVRRFLKVHREWDHVTMPVTRSFEVYKLVFDDNGSVVEQVELKSIGDQTVFVGNGQSMSVSASSFSCCRPNSIYYTSDSITVEDYYFNFIDCHQCDMGIFSLESGTTTPLQCYPSSVHHRYDPAIWILPPITGLC